jgi:hypothetical protein
LHCAHRAMGPKAMVTQSEGTVLGFLSILEALTGKNCGDRPGTLCSRKGALPRGMGELRG